MATRGLVWPHESPKRSQRHLHRGREANPMRTPRPKSDPRRPQDGSKSSCPRCLPPPPENPFSPMMAPRRPPMLPSDLPNGSARSCPSSPCPLRFT
eukprot:4350719-Pyramimonas_sp.AAC.1